MTPRRAWDRLGGATAPARRPATWVAPAILVALAFVLFLPAWLDPFHRFVGGDGDPIQAMWFLKWTPFAISHGLNPLWTDYMNVPTGVNLMWQSAAPLVSLLMCPVTATLGPVFAYNLFITLAVGVSGLLAYWAARNIFNSTFAAVVCAMAYEFSPFISVQAQGHAKVSFIFLPPLVFGALDRAIRQQRWSARRLGLTLGAAFAAQMFIFPEGVALGAIATTVGLIMLALLNLRHVRATVARLWRAIPWAALVFIPIVAGPLLFQFFGPNRLNGSVGGSNVYVADLTNLFLPTNAQAISPSFLSAITKHFSGNPLENNGYLGIFVLALLPITGWIARKNRIVVWVTLTGMVMTILSLGPQLHLGGQVLRFPLPWAPISQIPVLDNAYPSRFFVWVDLLAALEIGFFATLMVARWKNGRRKFALGAGLLLAGVVASYFPSEPFLTTAVTVPSAFTGGSLTSVIPNGSRVLVAPFTQNGFEDTAMLWQASSDFAFRMPEGYFIDRRFNDRWDGPGPSMYSQVLQAVERGAESIVGVGQRELINKELHAGGVTRVIVGPMDNQAVLDALFTTIYGTPAYDDGQVAVWKVI